MSVKEYSLKFIKLSKYASSLVSNARDEMSRFVMGVLKEVEEECRVDMLHDNIYLSKFMVHAQQVEESQLRMKNLNAKKERYFEGDSSKFKNMFSNHVPSKFPKACSDRVPNPSP